VSEKCKGPNLYNWKGGPETYAARMKAHAHGRRSAQNIPLDSAFIDALFKAQGGACFYCEGSLDPYAAVEHFNATLKGRRQ
jgi:hypothetical protein